MPSITTVHESLPYLDTEPTPDERAAAEALIAMERSTIPDDPHHALLPPQIQPTFTPFFQPELDRHAQAAAAALPSSSSSSSNSKPAAAAPLRAIDLTRYEAPDLDPQQVQQHQQQQQLEPALNQAYTSMSYLHARRQHLALLDSYGKNAWLVGNWQLEAELRALEREVADAKRDVDLVTLQRQRIQGETGGEIRQLEETWRRGVGRVLETEIAAEALRRQVLEAERARAQG